MTKMALQSSDERAIFSISITDPIEYSYKKKVILNSYLIS
jgi:hypothetical protein